MINESQIKRCQSVDHFTLEPLNQCSAIQLHHGNFLLASLNIRNSLALPTRTSEQAHVSHFCRQLCSPPFSHREDWYCSHLPGFKGRQLSWHYTAASAAALCGHIHHKTPFLLKLKPRSLLNSKSNNSYEWEENLFGLIWRMVISFAEL